MLILSMISGFRLFTVLKGRGQWHLVHGREHLPVVVQSLIGNFPALLTVAWYDLDSLK